MATVLVRLRFIDRTDRWCQNIRSALDTAGYFACIENGMSFGTLAGDAGVGTHGGSEDHAAILAGTPGQLSAFAFVPMRPLGEVAMPEDWRFVLAPSVIRSAKTGNAKAAYNNLARGAEVLLELWNGSHPPVPSLGALVERGGLEALRDLVDRSSLPDWPAGVLRKRLEHFVREDARVPDALDAFRAADVRRLEALAESSQADAEHLLGNQVPETIALARLAHERGALAACSFGAGFGGSVWALVDHDAEGFARRWQSGAFVALPSPPVTPLT
jgi:galactokinase